MSIEESPQEVWPLSRFVGYPEAYLICSASVQREVAELLKLAPIPEPSAVPYSAQLLVVAGGGRIIDEVKAWRFLERPSLRLAAISTIWGSGAEASPIAVLNGVSEKRFVIDPGVRPEIRSSMPNLAQALPSDVTRGACGDVWAHAIEGFLSPLATEELRRSLATLLVELSSAPMEFDPRWFEFSAQACAFQAQSSAGLIHAIAHQLEPRLARHGSSNPMNVHAALCATFLLPVFDLSRSASPKADKLLSDYGLSPTTIRDRLSELHDAANYRKWMPEVAAVWNQVLRDASARTSGFLVRAGHLAYLEQWRER